MVRGDHISRPPGINNNISFLTLSFVDDTTVMAKLLASFRTAPSGWFTTTDCCQWKNINCRSNRATSINLVSYQTHHSFSKATLSLDLSLPLPISVLSKVSTLTTRTTLPFLQVSSKDTQTNLNLEPKP